MHDDLVVSFVGKPAELFRGGSGEDNAIRHYFFDERLAK